MPVEEKAKVTIIGVRVKGQWFIGGKCVHMKNKALFLALENITFIERITYAGTLTRGGKL